MSHLTKLKESNPNYLQLHKYKTTNNFIITHKIFLLNQRQAALALQSADWFSNWKYKYTFLFKMSLWVIDVNYI